MSFRQFGGRNKSANSNYINNEYGASNNFGVSNVIGQPNTEIVFESAIIGPTGYFDSLIVNGSSKSFIIDHPLDPVNKHLVHVCLEGPEAGVYYRGEGEIENGESCIITLPDYVEALATDLTVQITPIYNGKPVYYLQTSKVKNNQFTVYGENGEFFWLVHGKRGQDIEVEPLKSSVEVKGNGPYKWI